MSRSRYIWCETGNHLIRTDDGSYCDHYIAKHALKAVESSMVIFRSPDGKVSIPWEPNTPTPAGYTREEVRGARAVRRLEKELDAKDIQRHKAHQAKVDYIFRDQRQKRREDLKQIIRDGVTTVKEKDGSTRTIHVTQMGRDIAAEALRRSESGYSKRYEPGNYRRE